MSAGDKSSPLFLQIKNDLRAQILSGQYPCGSRLPSASQLCRHYQVSLITVRRAIMDLMAEGMLTGVQGKGVFVAATGESRLDVGQLPRRSNLVGVVIPDLASSPFWAALVQGIETHLAAHGSHMLVGISHNNALREKEVLTDFAAHGVAGIILTPVGMHRTEGGDRELRALLEKGLPLVFLDVALEGFAADYVASNNEEGGYLATRHLLRLGHRRVAFIYANDTNSGRDRLSGYRHALAESEVPFSEELVRGHYGERIDYIEAGYQRTLELLRLPEPPTAVLAISDAIAQGVYRAAQTLKLRIPEDLSVMGYDNLPQAVFLSPPLSSVHQPRFEMGRKAAEVLLERLADPARPPRRVLLDSHVVERESCRELIPVAAGTPAKE